MMADPASFNKMILLILLIKGKEKLRSYILANISYRKKKSLQLEAEPTEGLKIKVGNQ